MKTCNSSRVIYHHYHRRQQQHIICNVPTGSEDEESSLKSSCRRSCSHKTFGFSNFPLIKGFTLVLILSSTLHLTNGSHLPSSYLVQKENSNNEYESNSNANIPGTVVPISTTVSSSNNVVTDATTTTIISPQEEPRPGDPAGNLKAAINDGLSTTTTQDSQSNPTTPSTPTSTIPSVLTSSYEDNNDSNLNYISEHDHYDEYAAMKAALEKEKSGEESNSMAMPPASERHPYLLQAGDGRKYASIEAICDDRQMKILGHFDDIFKGRMYSLGYSDEVECGTSNAKEPSHNITFSLPLGSCGVSMLALDDNLENDLRHEVTLYIQYSAFLQQVVDEKISVSCTEIKKSPVEEFLTSNEELMPSNRQGRRMGALGDPGGKFGVTKITSRIGESWMEILAGKDPSPKSRKLSPVSVGEDVTLVISTKVMRGYDARIVNCSAHDGSRTGTIDGSRAQQILDSAGCSLDRTLVPNLRRRRLPIESRNRLITLHFATFQAFKFPERDHLHIKCAVAYCQGPCPQEPCDSVLNHFGSWKDKYGRIADVLVDFTEVVNSVEVVAPELDDLGRSQQYDRSPSMTSGSYSSLSGGNSLTPASPADISGRQFGSEPTSSYNSYSSNGGAASAAPSAAASAGQSMFGNSQVPLFQPNPNGELHGSIGNSVCVSPGTVILALVILGVVLVISATATLWFALKRSEAKKYRHVKHSPFQPGPQPYYRFSHW